MSIYKKDIDNKANYNYTVYVHYIRCSLLGVAFLNIILSNHSDKPIYEQIAVQIKDLIIKGELAEAELLPSIRVLAKELQISVITTKRAYDELERDGYIASVPGKGSFVGAQNIELLKEARIRIVEDKLIEAVTAAKSIDISFEDLTRMLKLLFEEV